MKISQQDKNNIVEKLITTLVESLQDKNLAPAELLTECYSTWFTQEVAPYKSNPLYDLIKEFDSCEIKLRGDDGQDIVVTELAIHPNPIQYNATQYKMLYPRNMKEGQKLINTGVSSYYGRVDINLSSFPEMLKKVQTHNASIKEAVAYIRTETEKLTGALNTVNTYKQLQTRLPVIFNAMPEETKDKYETYRERIKNARRKKTEIPEDLGDFSSLGTTLAVASLKSRS